MKKYVCGLLVMLASYSVNAATTISFLMECNISTQSFDDRIIFTALNDDLLDNGETHFALWNTYGDLNNGAYSGPGAFGILGHQLTRMNSTTFARDYGFDEAGDGYIFEAKYADGSEVEIRFEYAVTDENGHNYNMSIYGRGEQYEYLIFKYNENLDTSEHYVPGDHIACTEREDLN